MLVKALRRLYKKLVGSECDAVTSAGVVNKLAEDYVAPTGTLPTVTAADNGKALIVYSGAWDKGAIPTELPAVTASDNGKVLKVANGAWSAGTEATELPAVTADDAGKVLTVSAEGVWTAVTPE